MQRRILFGVAILAPLPFLAGCGKQASAAWPSTLHFTYGVSAEMTEDSVRRVDLLRGYMARVTGMPVEVDRVVSYAPTIEVLCASRADAAIIGPFAYILASQKGCVEPLAVRGNDDGTPAGYRSIIATNKTSGIRSMEDLKAQSHRLTLSFNDPASTSGHLVPRAHLLSMGIEPERDFKNVMFAPNHLTAALTLKAGKVDVACMMESILPRLYDTGKMSKGDARILWTSPTIPNSPLVARKGLAPELKQKIRNAFLDMAKKAPELFAELGRASRSSGTRYVPATDAMYSTLRETARRIPNVQLLEQK